MEEYCPLCLERGIQSLTTFYQIDTTRAILGCKNTDCPFPFDRRYRDVIWNRSHTEIGKKSCPKVKLEDITLRDVKPIDDYFPNLKHSDEFLPSILETGNTSNFSDNVEFDSWLALSYDADNELSSVANNAENSNNFKSENQHPENSIMDYYTPEAVIEDFSLQELGEEQQTEELVLDNNGNSCIPVILLESKDEDVKDDYQQRVADKNPHSETSGLSLSGDSSRDNWQIIEEDYSLNNCNLQITAEENHMDNDDHCVNAPASEDPVSENNSIKTYIVICKDTMPTFDVDKLKQNGISVQILSPDNPSQVGGVHESPREGGDSGEQVIGSQRHKSNPAKDVATKVADNVWEMVEEDSIRIWLGDFNDSGKGSEMTLPTANVFYYLIRHFLCQQENSEVDGKDGNPPPVSELVEEEFQPTTIDAGNVYGIETNSFPDEATTDPVIPKKRRKLHKRNRKKLKKQTGQETLTATTSFPVEVPHMTPLTPSVSALGDATMFSPWKVTDCIRGLYVSKMNADKRNRTIQRKPSIAKNHVGIKSPNGPMQTIPQESNSTLLDESNNSKTFLADPVKLSGSVVKPGLSHENTNTTQKFCFKKPWANPRRKAVMQSANSKITHWRKSVVLPPYTCPKPSSNGPIASPAVAQSIVIRSKIKQLRRLMKPSPNFLHMKNSNIQSLSLSKIEDSISGDDAEVLSDLCTSESASTSKTTRSVQRSYALKAKLSPTRGSVINTAKGSESDGKSFDNSILLSESNCVLGLNKLVRDSHISRELKSDAIQLAKLTKQSSPKSSVTNNRSVGLQEFVTPSDVCWSETESFTLTPPAATYSRKSLIKPKHDQLMMYANTCLKISDSESSPPTLLPNSEHLSLEESDRTVLKECIVDFATPTSIEDLGIRSHAIQSKISTYSANMRLSAVSSTSVEELQIRSDAIQSENSTESVNINVSAKPPTGVEDLRLRSDAIQSKNSTESVNMRVTAIPPIGVEDLRLRSDAIQSKNSTESMNMRVSAIPPTGVEDLCLRSDAIQSKNSTESVNMRVSAIPSTEVEDLCLRSDALQSEHSTKSVNIRVSAIPPIVVEDLRLRSDAIQSKNSTEYLNMRVSAIPPIGVEDLRLRSDAIQSKNSTESMKMRVSAIPPTGVEDLCLRSDAIQSKNSTESVNMRVSAIPSTEVEDLCLRSDAIQTKNLTESVNINVSAKPPTGVEDLRLRSDAIQSENSTESVNIRVSAIPSTGVEDLCLRSDAIHPENSTESVNINVSPKPPTGVEDLRLRSDAIQTKNSSESVNMRVSAIPSTGVEDLCLRSDAIQSGNSTESLNMWVSAIPSTGVEDLWLRSDAIQSKNSTEYLNMRVLAIPPIGVEDLRLRSDAIQSKNSTESMKMRVSAIPPTGVEDLCLRSDAIQSKNSTESVNMRVSAVPPIGVEDLRLRSDAIQSKNSTEYLNMRVSAIPPIGVEDLRLRSDGIQSKNSTESMKMRVSARPPTGVEDFCLRSDAIQSENSTESVNMRVSAIPPTGVEDLCLRSDAIQSKNSTESVNMRVSAIPPIGVEDHRLRSDAIQSKNSTESMKMRVSAIPPTGVEDLCLRSDALQSKNSTESVNMRVSAIPPIGVEDLRLRSDAIQSKNSTEYLNMRVSAIPPIGVEDLRLRSDAIQSKNSTESMKMRVSALPPTGVEDLCLRSDAIQSENSTESVNMRVSAIPPTGVEDLCLRSDAIQSENSTESVNMRVSAIPPTGVEDLCLRSDAIQSENSTESVNMRGSAIPSTGVEDRCLRSDAIQSENSTESVNMRVSAIPPTGVEDLCLRSDAIHPENSTESVNINVSAKPPTGVEDLCLRSDAIQSKNSTESVNMRVLAKPPTGVEDLRLRSDAFQSKNSTESVNMEVSAIPPTAVEDLRLRSDAFQSKNSTESVNMRVSAIPPTGVEDLRLRSDAIQSENSTESVNMEVSAIPPTGVEDLRLRSDAIQSENSTESVNMEVSAIQPTESLNVKVLARPSTGTSSSGEEHSPTVTKKLRTFLEPFTPSPSTIDSAKSHRIRSKHDQLKLYTDTRKSSAKMEDFTLVSNSEVSSVCDADKLVKSNETVSEQSAADTALLTTTSAAKEVISTSPSYIQTENLVVSLYAKGGESVASFNNSALLSELSPIREPNSSVRDPHISRALKSEDIQLRELTKPSSPKSSVVIDMTNKATPEEFVAPLDVCKLGTVPASRESSPSITTPATKEVLLRPGTIQSKSDKPSTSESTSIIETSASAASSLGTSLEERFPMAPKKQPTFLKTLKLKKCSTPPVKSHRLGKSILPSAKSKIPSLRKSRVHLRSSLVSAKMKTGPSDRVARKSATVLDESNISSVTSCVEVTASTSSIPGHDILKKREIISSSTLKSATSVRSASSEPSGLLLEMSSRKAECVTESANLKTLAISSTSTSVEELPAAVLKKQPTFLKSRKLRKSVSSSIKSNRLRKSAILKTVSLKKCVSAFLGCGSAQSGRVAVKSTTLIDKSNTASLSPLAVPEETAISKRKVAFDSTLMKLNGSSSSGLTANSLSPESIRSATWEQSCCLQKSKGRTVTTSEIMESSTSLTVEPASPAPAEIILSNAFIDANSATKSTSMKGSCVTKLVSEANLKERPRLSHPLAASKTSLALQMETKTVRKIGRPRKTSVITVAGSVAAVVGRSSSLSKSNKKSPAVEERLETPTRPDEKAAAFSKESPIRNSGRQKRSSKDRPVNEYVTSRPRRKCSLLDLQEQSPERLETPTHSEEKATVPSEESSIRKSGRQKRLSKDQPVNEYVNSRPRRKCSLLDLREQSPERLETPTHLEGKATVPSEESSIRKSGRQKRLSKDQPVNEYVNSRPRRKCSLLDLREQSPERLETPTHLEGKATVPSEESSIRKSGRQKRSSESTAERTLTPPTTVVQNLSPKAKDQPVNEYVTSRPKIKCSPLDLREQSPDIPDRLRTPFRAERLETPTHSEGKATVPSEESSIRKSGRQKRLSKDQPVNEYVNSRPRRKCSPLDLRGQSPEKLETPTHSEEKATVPSEESSIRKSGRQKRSSESTAERTLTRPTTVVQNLSPKAKDQPVNEYVTSRPRIKCSPLDLREQSPDIRERLRTPSREERLETPTHSEEKATVPSEESSIRKSGRQKRSSESTAERTLTPPTTVIQNLSPKAKDQPVNEYVTSRPKIKCSPLDLREQSPDIPERLRTPFRAERLETPTHSEGKATVPSEESSIRKSGRQKRLSKDQPVNEYVNSRPRRKCSPLDLREQSPEKLETPTHSEEKATVPSEESSIRKSGRQKRSSESTAERTLTPPTTVVQNLSPKAKDQPVNEYVTSRPRIKCSPLDLREQSPDIRERLRTPSREERLETPTHSEEKATLPPEESSIRKSDRQKQSSESTAERTLTLPTTVIQNLSPKAKDQPVNEYVTSRPKIKCSPLDLREQSPDIPERLRTPFRAERLETPTHSEGKATVPSEKSSIRKSGRQKRLSKDQPVNEYVTSRPRRKCSPLDLREQSPERLETPTHSEEKAAASSHCPLPMRSLTPPSTVVVPRAPEQTSADNLNKTVQKPNVTVMPSKSTVAATATFNKDLVSVRQSRQNSLVTKAAGCSKASMIPVKKPSRLQYNFRSLDETTTRRSTPHTSPCLSNIPESSNITRNKKPIKTCASLKSKLECKTVQNSFSSKETVLHSQSSLKRVDTKKKGSTVQSRSSVGVGNLKTVKRQLDTKSQEGNVQASLRRSCSNKSVIHLV